MSSISAFSQARNALRLHEKEAAVISAGTTILYMLLWMIGTLIEQAISPLSVAIPLPLPIHLADLLLPLLLIGAACVVSLYRNRVDEQIGSITGVLTECDLGFLACSGRFWLWQRRMSVLLLANTLLILAFVPSMLLLTAAMLTLQLATTVGDATLHLMLLLHLLTGAILLLVLPLRIWCAMAAIPLCYLKQPHRSVWAIWHYAMLCTKGICGKLLQNRVRCAACIILPVYWFSAYPQRLATEMLLCSQNSQDVLPDR